MVRKRAPMWPHYPAQSSRAARGWNRDVAASSQGAEHLATDQTRWTAPKSDHLRTFPSRLCHRHPSFSPNHGCRHLLGGPRFTTPDARYNSRDCVLGGKFGQSRASQSGGLATAPATHAPSRALRALIIYPVRPWGSAGHRVPLADGEGSPPGNHRPTTASSRRALSWRSCQRPAVGWEAPSAGHAWGCWRASSPRRSR